MAVRIADPDTGKPLALDEWSGVEDYWIRHARKVIAGTYGHNVSVDEKKKDLLRFGQSNDIGTSFEVVWNQGGIETLPTTNAIDKISSSSASDTGPVRIEGHTISGNDLTFVVQTVSAAGQTETNLNTPLARAVFMENAGSEDFVGDVYVYEDDTVTNGVPQTAAKIHIKSLAGDNVANKCATAISSQDYWILTNLYAVVSQKASAAVDFRIEIKAIGGVWKKIFEGSAKQDGPSINHSFKPYMIVPPNHDIRVIAKASTTSVAVRASLNGVLAVIT